MQEIKYCIDCDNYIAPKKPNWLGTTPAYNPAWCRAYKFTSSVDIISGKIIPPLFEFCPCEIARRNGGWCGRSAKHFKKKLCKKQ
jgi:hypothetical protein